MDMCLKIMVITIDVNSQRKANSNTYVMRAAGMLKTSYFLGLFWDTMLLKCNPLLTMTEFIFPMGDTIFLANIK